MNLCGTPQFVKPAKLTKADMPPVIWAVVGYRGDHGIRGEFADSKDAIYGTPTPYVPKASYEALQAENKLLQAEIEANTAT